MNKEKILNIFNEYSQNYNQFEGKVFNSVFISRGEEEIINYIRGSSLPVITKPFKISDRKPSNIEFLKFENPPKTQYIYGDLKGKIATYNKHILDELKQFSEKYKLWITYVPTVVFENTPPIRVPIQIEDGYVILPQPIQS